MVATTATQALTDLAGAAPDAPRGTQSPPLPDLSPLDAAIFDRYIECAGDLPALAQSLKDKPPTPEELELSSNPTLDPTSPTSPTAPTTPESPISPLRPLGPIRPISLPTTVRALYLWTLRPEIQPWLDFHDAQETARLKRTHLANLDKLARESNNEVERRRASIAVLRIVGAPLGGTPLGGTPLRGVRNSPSSPRGGGRGGRAGGAAGEGSVSTGLPTSTPSPTHSTSSSPSSSSSSSSDPPKPKFAPPVIYHTSQQQDLLLALCAEGPGKVPNPWGSALAVAHNTPNHAVRFILNALQNMTEPGLITLFNFTGPMDRSLHAFQAFIPTIEKLFPTRFKSYEVLSITQTGDHTFTSEVLITNQDDSTKPLTLRFHRPTTGIHLHCWHLTLPDSS